MKRDVVRAFLSILGSRVGVFLVALATTPILVRLLGSSGYGDYALMLSAMGLAHPILASGTFNGVRKFIAEQRGIRAWRSSVFGFYARVTFVLCAAAGGLLYAGIATGLVEGVFGRRFDVFFLLLIPLLFARSFLKLGRGALMGLGAEHLSEPLRVLERLLFAVLGLSLVYAGWGVSGALAGLLGAAVVVTGATLVLLRPRLDLTAVLRPTPDRISRPELLSFGFFSVLLGFLTVSLYHVDVLLLQPLGGSSQTGYYKAALVVAEFLWFVPMAVQYALVQSVSDFWSRGQRDRVERLVGRIVRYSATLLLLLILGVAALAPRVVPLYYGADFRPAVVPLYLLLPGVLGFALARPVFAAGQGIGRLRVLVTATGVAAAANLALNLVLIPRFGMHGAAVATSVSYGSMLVLHVRAARTIGFRPLRDLRPGRLVITAALSAPVIFGLEAIVASTALALVVVPVAGLAVYSTVALRVRLVEPDDVHRLLQRAPDGLRRGVMRLVRRLA